MGYILSLLTTFLLSAGTIKFVLITGLYLLVTLLFPLIMSFVQIPGIGDFQTLYTGLPSNVHYFLNYFGVSYGLPLILKAHIIAFAVRRIPIFGK